MAAKTARKDPASSLQVRVDGWDEIEIWISQRVLDCLRVITVEAEW